MAETLPPTADPPTDCGGIQTSDSAGRVTFTTIYPGWYQGRATHIHVDVTMNGRSVKVTQIAFPESLTAALYSTGVYAPKGQNPTTNTRDNVFADSVASEMASVAGDPTAGYTATFAVGITASGFTDLRIYGFDTSLKYVNS